MFVDRKTGLLIHVLCVQPALGIAAYMDYMQTEQIFNETDGFDEWKTLN